jgi:hypothetical protein
MPGLLQIALTSGKYNRETRFLSPPLLIQRVVFSVLTPFARLAGYKAVYPKYLD